MIVAFVISILAVLLCLFDGNKARRKFGGLELGFLVLTTYLCIRYDYGNDYMSYLNDFKIYNSYKYSLTDIDTLIDLQSRGDFGWVIINILCKPLGYFGMIMLLTVLFMGQIYYFIKRYVPPKWYWFSVFLFAFHPSLMVVGVAGMIRQWTAIFIFLCCIDFIRRRRIIPYMVLILVATTIHKTAFILFPVCFISYIKLNGKGAAFMFFFFLLAWYILAPLIPNGIIMSLFENEYLEAYGETIGRGAESKFGISSIIFIGMPLLCLSQMRDQNKSVHILFKLLLLGLLFHPFLSLNMTIGRLVFYFSVLSIVTYPLTIDSLMRKNDKILGISIVFVFIIYYIIIFRDHFVSEVWFRTSYIYKTILEVPWQ